MSTAFNFRGLASLLSKDAILVSSRRRTAWRESAACSQEDRKSERRHRRSERLTYPARKQGDREPEPEAKPRAKNFVTSPGGGSARQEKVELSPKPGFIRRASLKPGSFKPAKNAAPLVSLGVMEKDELPEPQELEWEHRSGEHRSSIFVCHPGSLQLQKPSDLEYKDALSSLNLSGCEVSIPKNARPWLKPFQLRIDIGKGGCTMGEMIDKLTVGFDTDDERDVYAAFFSRARDW